MQESHAACDVKGETDGLSCVDHQTTSFVQDGIQLSMNHVLVDDNKVGRVIAADYHRKDVGMRKNAKTREFLVEVARNPCCTLTDGQEFGNNIVTLPSSSP